jgi:hypothetical protein
LDGSRAEQAFTESYRGITEIAHSLHLADISADQWYASARLQFIRLHFAQTSSARVGKELTPEVWQQLRTIIAKSLRALDRLHKEIQLEDDFDLQVVKLASKSYHTRRWMELHVNAEKGHTEAKWQLGDEICWECKSRADREWIPIKEALALEDASCEECSCIWLTRWGERGNARNQSLGSSSNPRHVRPVSLRS